MLMKTITTTAMLACSLMIGTAQAQSPGDLNDLEIAHVAYVADSIDIRYAHLALAISKNPEIHKFARTMIRDHEAVNVNVEALALLKKLGVQPKDNFLSQSLSQDADRLVEEMRKLTGAAFDRRYASNELGYHRAVNDLVEKTFIPNIENGQVKALFRKALKIFKVHEGHAEKMVDAVS